MAIRLIALMNKYPHILPKKDRMKERKGERFIMEKRTLDSTYGPRVA